MKTKSIILLNIVLLCFALNIQAQSEDIRQQIKDYKKSRWDLILNARALLLDKIEEGDLHSTSKITNYIIDSLENHEYLGLWDREKILIYYNLHDYNSVLNMFRVVDNARMLKDLQRRITPTYSSFFQKLQNKLVDNYEKLADGIDSANLPEEDKSFLQLALVYMLYDAPKGFSNQIELNKLSNKYIENYPRSPHNKHIKNRIRREYAPSNWGWGLELASGYGIFTNDLKQAFTNPIPFIFSVDIGYKKFISNVRIYTGFHKTKKDILLKYKGTEWCWTKNNPAASFIPELSLGYTVWENKTIKMYPYTLIGATQINPMGEMKDRPEFKNSFISSFTYGLGLNLDFKTQNERTTIYDSPNTGGYTAIRVRYSYNINNFKHYSGNFHSITIGLMFFTRDPIFR